LGKIDLNIQNIECGNIVISRHNNGLGDIIMCLPIFGAIHDINPNIHVYFDIQERYKWILENNPYCQFYEGQKVDFHYDFENGFENTSEKKHRTDIFADFLGIELQNKQPVIYKTEYDLSNDFDLPDKYGLIFLKSANIYRQIPEYIAQRLQNILAEMGILTFVFISQGIIINNKVISTSMEDLSWLIKNSSICIGPDSGPIHVAGAMNVPFLVLSNIIDSHLRYEYYSVWHTMETSLNLSCLYQCDRECFYDFPPPCLRFFDFKEIEEDVNDLMGDSI
jgi:ADP-heptose:LPS heptosyltransferase